MVWVSNHKTRSNVIFQCAPSPNVFSYTTIYSFFFFFLWDRILLCRAAVLNMWAASPLRFKWSFHRGHLRPSGNIFTLQLITVSKLQLRSSNKSNSMVVVTTTWGTVWTLNFEEEARQCLGFPRTTDTSFLMESLLGVFALQWSASI